MSKPLKRSCYYCHQKSFKGYVEAQYLISLQMMAISAEQGLSCADCHLGRRGLTELGAQSLIQWRYSHEKGLDCSDCHQPKGRFRSLTPRGLEASSRVMSELEERGRTLGVSPEVITRWIARFESDNLKQPSTSPALLKPNEPPATPQPAPTSEVSP
jgi:hypothetical protein